MQANKDKILKKKNIALTKMPQEAEQIKPTPLFSEIISEFMAMAAQKADTPVRHAAGAEKHTRLERQVVLFHFRYAKARPWFIDSAQQSARHAPGPDRTISGQVPIPPTLRPQLKRRAVPHRPQILKPNRLAKYKQMLVHNFRMVLIVRGHICRDILSFSFIL